MRKNLSHKRMQYNYSMKMFTGRAKPIRIIGNRDNQFPDKWSFVVLKIYKVLFVREIFFLLDLTNF
jgi:hypothetical protein